MPDLWGMDDPVAERAIKKRAESKATGIPYLLITIFSGAFIGTLANILNRNVLHVNIPDWIMPSIGVWIGFALGDLYAKRARREALKQVLRSERRCVQCGYQLDSEITQCPECGTKCEAGDI